MKRRLAVLAVLAAGVLSCGQCAVGQSVTQTNGSTDTVAWVVGAVVVLCFMVFCMALCSMGFGVGPRQ
jgi:hypothetical protein